MRILTLRYSKLALVLAMVSVGTQSGCEADPQPVSESAPSSLQPDAAVSATPDVGVQLPDVGVAPGSNGPVVADFVFEFTGRVNVETGTVEFQPLGFASDDGDSGLRTQSLPMFCEMAVVEDGVPNSSPPNTLEILNGSTLAFDDDCGMGPAGQLYSERQGAICIDIIVRSFFDIALTDVYAEILTMEPFDATAAYTFAERGFFGLGNGAEVPPGSGLSDLYGLFAYGDLGPLASAPGNESITQWVFKNEGATEFQFEGRIVASFVELCDNRDNDCDGFVDEGANCFDTGDDCVTDEDCEFGVCGCDGLPCPGDTTATCRIPSCGDSIVDPGEDCDTGAVDTSTCNANCTDALCGDGYRNTFAGEGCDDGAGNSNSGSCLSTCQVATCGDSLTRTDVGPGLPGFESCDDGRNGNNADGCTDACLVAVCGDGFVRSDLAVGQPGHEACDEGPTGNLSSGSCPSCQLAICGDGLRRTDILVGQPGYEACDGGPTGSATCNTDCTVSVCGDNIINTAAGEECDDGAGGSATCTAACLLTRCGDGVVNTLAGEVCDNGALNSDAGACLTTCQPAVCGDGLTRGDIAPGQPGHEACDNGALNSDTIPDRCRTDCSLPRCGDDVLDIGESCDDGVLNSATAPGACRLDCALFSCGDNIVDPGEFCDNGLLNSNTTPNACRGNCNFPSCGDNVQDAGEACDTGSLIGNNSACRPGCVQARCGDGVVRTDRILGQLGYEACDDGDSDGGDGCSALCIVETGYVCGTPGAPCTPVCGDGIRTGAEVCDDGNVNNGDGCNSTCSVVTPGYNCSTPGVLCSTICGDAIRVGAEQCDLGGSNSNTGACTLGCQLPRCGDGFRQGAEQCDDGNSTNNDACSNTCTTATCGDSIVQAGEQCDLGASNSSGGACTEVCQNARCGDGRQRTGLPVTNPSYEACDDGNTSNTDACLNTCRAASCGDGFVQATVEQCDDTNTVNTDSCVACQNARCGDGFVRTDITLTTPAAASYEFCDGGTTCTSACRVDADGDGALAISSQGNDCNDGNAAIRPGAAENWFDSTDSDCDGFTGNIDQTVFVRSTCVTPTWPGTVTVNRTFTCATTPATAISSSTGTRNTLVFAPETFALATSLTVPNGRNLYGGYTSAFAWSGTSTRPTLNYTANTTDQIDAAIRNSQAISSASTFRSLNINTLQSSTTEPGTSRYGVHCNDCDGLRMEHLTISVAAGVAGTNGSNGSPGASGTAGTQGAHGLEDGTCIWFWCSSSPRAPGGAGGTSACGANGGRGGNGAAEDESPAGNGVGGSGAGAGGGGSGGSGNSCGGHRGNDGGAGANGNSPVRNGGYANGWLVNLSAPCNGCWIANSGRAGEAGGNGGGGGGGGGSTGDNGFWCVNGSGNAGGGGGGGGCGGGGGGAGMGGGGSFGIFLVDSGTSGSQLVISNTSITTGAAGNGGNGGDGANGGSGANGGTGGGDVSSANDMVRGATGGRGGNGGNGGQGGGGQGGFSVGIYNFRSFTNPSTMTYSIGAAGTGGAGGNGVTSANGRNGLSANVYNHTFIEEWFLSGLTITGSNTPGGPR